MKKLSQVISNHQLEAAVQHITEMAKLNVKDGSQSEFPSNAYRVWVQGENSSHKQPHIHIRNKQDGYEIKVYIETGKLFGVNTYGSRHKSDNFEDVLKMANTWFDKKTTMPGRIGTNRDAAMNEWEACNTD